MFYLYSCNNVNSGKTLCNFRFWFKLKQTNKQQTKLQTSYYKINSILVNDLRILKNKFFSHITYPVILFRLFTQTSTQLRYQCQQKIVLLEKKEELQYLIHQVSHSDEYLVLKSQKLPQFGVYYSAHHLFTSPCSLCVSLSISFSFQQ